MQTTPLDICREGWSAFFIICKWYDFSWQNGIYYILFRIMIEKSPVSFPWHLAVSDSSGILLQKESEYHSGTRYCRLLEKMKHVIVCTIQQRSAAAAPLLLFGSSIDIYRLSALVLPVHPTVCWLIHDDNSRKGWSTFLEINILSQQSVFVDRHIQSFFSGNLWNAFSLGNA